MGVWKPFSSDFDDPCDRNHCPPQNNPNPKNHEIIKVEVVGEHLIVLIKYPDCKNYGGLKILVYRSLSEEIFRNMIEIDPHFSEYHTSPMARFKPTEDGWILANVVANLIS